MKDSSSPGVSTVIGALLILCLIVSVVAVAKMAYVPDMKKQAEADHMNNALSDFMSHKTALDLAAQGVQGTMVTTKMELGGGEIPVIDKSRSSGSIAINPSYGQLNVTAYYRNGSMLQASGRTNMGSIVYNSSNHYWIDQGFHYEDGMVILSQYNGFDMLARPDIDAVARPGTLVTVMVNPMRIDGKASSISSTGTDVISSSIFSGDRQYVSANVTNVTINVTTDYPGLWSSFFRSEFSGAGLVEGSNFSVTTGGQGGRNVTAYLWTGVGGNLINLGMLDSDFITTVGSQITLQVSPTPTATPTPTVMPTATPTPKPTITTTPTPGPASRLILSPTSITVGKHGIFIITVTAVDSNGIVVPSYVGTVTITDDQNGNNNGNNGNNLHGTTTYKFTASDAGVHSFSDLWYSSSGTFSIYATDGTLTSNTITVTSG